MQGLPACYPICLLFSAPLADVRLEPGVGIQDFLLVVRTALIEDDVANHNEKLLALAAEAPRERLLTRHVHESFAHPLPELFLGGPELVVVGAHDPRSLLRTSFNWG